MSGPVAQVMIDTPGADVPLASLSMNSPVTVIAGPGTFRVKRVATSQSIGVYSEI